MKEFKILITLIIITVLTSIIVFAISHKTYYKYNDWKIVGNSINNVQELYGEFDCGDVNIEKGKGGTVGYYLYTQNSGFDPDYLPRYYYIHYDINGIVDKVEVQASYGG